MIPRLRLAYRRWICATFHRSFHHLAWSAGGYPVLFIHCTHETCGMNSPGIEQGGTQLRWSKPQHQHTPYWWLKSKAKTGPYYYTPLKERRGIYLSVPARVLAIRKGARTGR
jgi:hypothetical protein